MNPEGCRVRVTGIHPCCRPVHSPVHHQFTTQLELPFLTCGTQFWWVFRSVTRCYTRCCPWCNTPMLDAYRTLT